MLSFLGNVIWFVMGGVFMALGWFLAGCLMACCLLAVFHSLKVGC